MRLCFAAVVGTLGLGAFAAADAPTQSRSPDVKDVEVTLSVPPTVLLTPSQRRGDTVASFAVKVTIENKSLEPIPFGLHYLSRLGFAGALGQPYRQFAIKWREWPGPTNKSVSKINPGQTFTTTCHYSFLMDPDQPRKGEVYYIRLTIYGHQASADITLK